jgi:hypothetical protein
MFIALLSSVLIFAAGAEAQTLNETLLSTDNAYNPIPSPDGRYIAYVRTSWGRPGGSGGFGRSNLVSEVVVIDENGVPISAMPLAETILGGWTRDNNHLVCFRDWTYALVSIDGERVMEGRIPMDEKLNSPSEWVGYSPSLASIVWSRQVDKSHRAIETPSRTIVRETVLWPERVVPSPDGRYLAVLRESPKTDLRVYDTVLQSWTDLGEMSIHPDKDWFYIQPNWSPWFDDGARLVFLRDSTLVISAPDGSQKTEIKIDGPAGLPVPSPDGKSVAYVTYEPRPMNNRPDLQFWGGTTIRVLPILGGSGPRTVTQKSPDEVLDLKWLHNDTLVFDRVADAMFYKQARIWKVSIPK